MGAQNISARILRGETDEFLNGQVRELLEAQNSSLKTVPLVSINDAINLAPVGADFNALMLRALTIYNQQTNSRHLTTRAKRFNASLLVAIIEEVTAHVEPA